MPRGNGQKAKSAMTETGPLARFIQPKDERNHANAQEYVDWGEINPTLIVSAICVANKQGGALLFGQSRRKDCYAVTVFFGGQNTPYYFPCNADGVDQCEEFLQGIIWTENHD